MCVCICVFRFGSAVLIFNEAAMTDLQFIMADDLRHPLQVNTRTNKVNSKKIGINFFCKIKMGDDITFRRLILSNSFTGSDQLSHLRTWMMKQR